MNAMKTGILLTLLTALLIWLGALFGGQAGMLIAFGFALIMNVSAYWFSDRVVLRMYRAQPISEAEDPELYGIVADLSQRARIPMPKVYVIPSDALNAFATGRNPRHAAVAVTRGLRGKLDRNELTGVLAHELSHVKNRDILIGTVAATIAGAISMFASMAQWGAIFGGFGSDDDEGGNPIMVFVVSMIAALAASLVQLAISRSREFGADAGAAKLTGDPSGLISALRKLEIGAQRVPLGGNPATAHLFIVSPLRGGRMSRFFSTHPPVEERIRRLRGIVGLTHS